MIPLMPTLLSHLSCELVRLRCTTDADFTLIHSCFLFSHHTPTLLSDSATPALISFSSPGCPPTQLLTCSLFPRCTQTLLSSFFLSTCSEHRHCTCSLSNRLPGLGSCVVPLLAVFMAKFSGPHLSVLLHNLTLYLKCVRPFAL